MTDPVGEFHPHWDKGNNAQLRWSAGELIFRQARLQISQVYWRKIKKAASDDWRPKGGGKSRETNAEMQFKTP